MTTMDSSPSHAENWSQKKSSIKAMKISLDYLDEFWSMFGWCEVDSSADERSFFDAVVVESRSVIPSEI